MIGDFNTGALSNTSFTSQFLCIMNVQYPTHDSGHALNLIFLRDNFLSLTHMSVTEGFSVHSCVPFYISFPCYKSRDVIFILTRSFKFTNFDVLSLIFDQYIVKLPL